MRTESVSYQFVGQWECILSQYLTRTVGMHIVSVSYQFVGQWECILSQYLTSLLDSGNAY